MKHARPSNVAYCIQTSTDHAHPDVNIRDPPTLAVKRFPTWVPPPTGWIFKPWYQVQSSNEQNLQLRNFQWDPTPVDASNPDGPINDLSSFQLQNNDKVYTSYGVATPNNSFPALLDYRGTGILENATSQYSWLGWGCDINGNDYYVSYSSSAEASNSPAGLDIMSVVDTGVDQQTADTVIKKLKNSDLAEIRELSGRVIGTIQDGGRRGMDRIDTCDDECKTNKDLIDIIGGGS
ncbi:hypothetical protein N0V90_004761 [Kalmusia sp. IMI 367209]|nr:hypothetical protein N0V90_004761 [Kalmusia sp. IMI 367209]